MPCLLRTANSFAFLLYISIISAVENNPPLGIPLIASSFETRKANLSSESNLTVPVELVIPALIAFRRENPKTYTHFRRAHQKCPLFSYPANNNFHPLPLHKTPTSLLIINRKELNFRSQTKRRKISHTIMLILFRMLIE